MAGKKPISPKTYHKKAQKRAMKTAANAKKRAQSYSRGDKLIQQASKTLSKVAASHPNPKARKQAKRAVAQLKQAHAAFGSASMCMDGPTFNNDES
ncbi:MAG TPA: hypothetical protein VGO35_12555 [Gammaproteobacteria bacterium]|jgi:hypothetical protein|nr:hypothetical protein [Gammaproteobacteria bacterium]